MDNDIGQLCYLAYLFAIRVQSDAAKLTWAYANDPVAQFIHQREKALIAVRKYDQTLALVIKSAYRGTEETDVFLRGPAFVRNETWMRINFAMYM